MDIETYQKVKQSVNSILGINLNFYKDEQMRRRLDAWLARSGAKDWVEYFARIRKDEIELSRFRNYLTINVTEFFRDFERWQYLKQRVLPELLQVLPNLRPNRSTLRLWSAGCSVGAEPFSMSILMDELSPAKPHYILATDLDQGALSKAKAGGPFAAEEIKNVSPAQRNKYFKPGGPPHFVNENLIKKITFKEQNLITDTFEKDFDLIICRNVVIYFTGETKDILYKKFCSALRIGGMLFIGGTEIIPKSQEIGLKGQGISFYVRTQ